jgi:hypothetical protein
VPAAERDPGKYWRRWFVGTIVAACLALIPWIVVLAATLPPRYLAGHWRAAWVGFDLLMLLGLAATAWAGWRRRKILLLFATVTGTLLVCDAWFDVTTASGDDLWVSIAGALLGELPLAAFLFYVAQRLLRLTIRQAAMHDDRPLHHLPLLGPGRD